MGLFKKRKRTDSQYTWMTVGDALQMGRGVKTVPNETVIKVTSELCEQIKYLRAQQEETKYEYNQVTGYLTDIQKLDRLSEKEHAEVTDAARMVVSLDEERIRYKNGPRSLTTVQYHTMEMYESEIPDKIRRLEEHERYLDLVREDMRNLEGEKGSIKYEKESAGDKKCFLNKFSIGVTFVVLLLFIVLIVVMSYTGKSLIIPFFITGVAALGYVAYYIYAIGQCSTTVKRDEYALNRANALLNTVKIKFVNTTNAIDFIHEKYGVNSTQELRYVWENYVRAKDEEKRFRRNTQLLNNYLLQLEAVLTQLGIGRTDAWAHQPEVLLSRGEMADYRDAISRRRNKLRAQMDYNIRQQDTTRNEIEALRNKYTAQTELIDGLLEKYGI